MNEEVNLPEGLQLAVKLLAQIGDDESDRAIAAVHAAADERDELRAKYDELLVALHGIGAALGIQEGDRSPYSVTCGVLERVNRLAEIEAFRAEHPAPGQLTDAMADAHADAVLRAAGSSLRNYTMQSSRDAIRMSVRAIETAVFAANGLEVRRG